MSRRDDAQRLRDMRDAAQAAIRVLGDHSADELENTEALALAVPHAVEIVGEAASRVSRPFCEAHPEIAWSEVTGMRHRIVHDYFAVDRAARPPSEGRRRRLTQDRVGASG